MWRFVVIGSLSMAPLSSALAWGDNGHKTICGIAMKEVSAPTRAQIEQLMQQLGPSAILLPAVPSRTIFRASARRNISSISRGMRPPSPTIFALGQTLLCFLPSWKIRSGPAAT